MANLEFLDSCGHYDAATSIQKYNNPNTPTISASGGRFGYQALSTGQTGPQVTFKSNLAEIYCGFAFKLSGVLSCDMVQVLDAGTPHATIRITADGRINIVNSANSVVATSTISIFLDDFYYLETYFNIDNAGSVEVRLNEVTVVTWSGDTQVGTRAYATHIGFLPTGSGSQTRIFGDVYVHKTAFLGDIKVRYIKPNGAGTYADFTSTGANQWSVTDDVPPNGDSDYIYSSTVNQKSSCAMEDVTLDGTCEGIQVLVSVRKDEANVRKIKTLIIEGGTETLGDEESIPAGYYYARTCYDTNPRTGVKFTDSDLDGIEAGVKLTA